MRTRAGLNGFRGVNAEDFQAEYVSLESFLLARVAPTRALHGQRRGVPAPREALCRVDRGMVAVSARDAAEDRLAFAAPSITDTARRASVHSAAIDRECRPDADRDLVLDRRREADVPSRLIGPNRDVLNLRPQRAGLDPSHLGRSHRGPPGIEVPHLDALKPIGTPSGCIGSCVKSESEAGTLGSPAVCTHSLNDTQAKARFLPGLKTEASARDSR